MNYEYNSSGASHRSPLLIRILIFLVYMAAGGALIGILGMVLSGGSLSVVEADSSPSDVSTAAAAYEIRIEHTFAVSGEAPELYGFGGYGETL